MKMVVLPGFRHFSRMAAPFQTTKENKATYKKEGKETGQNKDRWISVSR
jgi:hypothetical protein